MSLHTSPLKVFGALAWVLSSCGPVESVDPPASDVPRCTDTPNHVSCLHQAALMSTGFGGRTVHWQEPMGDAPDGGFPVVIFYQGSFVSAVSSWESSEGDAFGRFELAKTIEALLGDGYTVLTPDTALNGSTYWGTNQVFVENNWSGSPDDQVVLAMFAGLDAGTFGPVDPSRLYAMGISSGGFMTSRMAVSYAGKFRALAINSASYATCSFTCSVPATLPADHPPTLFLHGQQDVIVPIGTMWPYEMELTNQGISTSTEIDPDAGHQWLTAGITRIPAWFDANP